MISASGSESPLWHVSQTARRVPLFSPTIVIWRRTTIACDFSNENAIQITAFKRWLACLVNRLSREILYGFHDTFSGRLSKLCGWFPHYDLPLSLRQSLENS